MNQFESCHEVSINANRIYSDINPNKDYIDELTGIRTTNSDSVLVVNNEISFPYGAMGTVRGIAFSRNTKGHIVNNSLLIGGGEKIGNTSSCISDENPGTGDILNNIAASIHEQIYSLHLNATYAIGTYNVDYNCWSSKGSIAYVYANSLWNEVNDLASLTMLVSTAVHDVVFLPAFTNDSDLHIVNFNKLNCPRFPSLNYDKDGLLRSAITTRGCYGTYPPQKDASLVSILNWDGTTYVGDSIRPRIVLQNSGLDTLTKATISFNLNDEAMPTHTASS